MLGDGLRSCNFLFFDEEKSLTADIDTTLYIWRGGMNISKTDWICLCDIAEACYLLRVLNHFEALFVRYLC